MESGSENLLAEILKIGLGQLMEAERDEHISADRYERNTSHKSSTPRRQAIAFILFVYPMLAIIHL